jgi:hypothetical protein
LILCWSNICLRKLFWANEDGQLFVCCIVSNWFAASSIRKSCQHRVTARGLECRLHSHIVPSYLCQPLRGQRCTAACNAFSHYGTQRIFDAPSALWTASKRARSTMYPRQDMVEVMKGRNASSLSATSSSLLRVRQGALAEYPITVTL